MVGRGFLFFRMQAPPLNQPTPSLHTPSRWVWCVLVCWLVYSFGTLAWYLLNDPAFMASICIER